MIKSDAFGPNNQFSLKYYTNWPHWQKKFNVETDYLPYINFNGIIRATFRYKLSFLFRLVYELIP